MSWGGIRRAIRHDRERFGLSNEADWRRRFRFRKPVVIAASVAGAVVVSGAAVSAATFGPGQDGSPAAANAVAARHPKPAAYHSDSPWGPQQTNVDQQVRHSAVSKVSSKKIADLKRKEARERAREKARAAAKKRAAEAKKRAASRSNDRSPVSHSGGGGSPGGSSGGSSGDSVPSGSPKSIAKKLLADRGWSSQFGCLDKLWEKESGWSVTAANPSGAYGIPQALPGSKMASAGPDWQHSAATQIKWGLGYIADRYGGPCSAWNHSQANNWY